MTVSVSDAPTIPLIAPGSAAVCLGGSVDLTATSSGQATFSGGGVNIQFTGALPYPSTISVSGLPTSGVTVRSIQLNGVTHATPDDIDMLLRSLAGTNVVLMSDVGGTNAISNNNYVLQDGSAFFSDNGAIPSGTYRPTNFETTDNYPAPGPGNVTQANPLLSGFGGNMN